MVDQYRRRTPLSALAIAAVPGAAVPGAGATRAEAPVILTECGPRGQLALRGDAGDAAFNKAVRSVLGAAPSAIPNHVAQGRQGALLWLGPDEWLAVLAPGREVEMRAALDTALGGLHALVTDVSHARGVISLSGPGACDVLARGCSLDLHPGVFGVGRCAQSTLARCHVLLHRRDDAPTFDLYVHRSFMEYAWVWLVDASGPSARLVAAADSPASSAA